MRHIQRQIFYPHHYPHHALHPPLLCHVPTSKSACARAARTSVVADNPRARTHTHKNAQRLTRTRKDSLLREEERVPERTREGERGAWRAKTRRNRERLRERWRERARERKGEGERCLGRNIGR